MADSTGVGFPTTNLQLGHVFHDLDEHAQYKFVGGDPRVASSWVVINGAFNVQPDTSLWGTKQAGAMWLYVPEKTYYGWDGTRMIRIAFAGGDSFYNYRTQYAVQDEFITGGNATGIVGWLGWTAGAGSATVAGQPSEVNAPGIFQLTTTTTINTIARLTFNGAFVLFLTSNVRMTSIQRLNTIDADTTCRVGYGNATNTDPPNNGIYFEKLTGDTNWFCVTRASATQTRTDSGVPIVAAMTKLEIVIDGETVTFFINGNLVATHTTNAPIGTIQLSPFYQIVNAVAASKTLDIDYFQLLLDNISR